MWHCVILVTTAVSEECIAPIIRMGRISELGTILAVRLQDFTAVTMKNGVF
jgi:hypothetical protein